MEAIEHKTNTATLHPIYGAKLSPEQFRAMTQDARYAAIQGACRAAVKMYRETSDHHEAMCIYWSIRNAQEEPACSWERYWTYAVISHPMTDAEIKFAEHESSVIRSR